MQVHQQRLANKNSNQAPGEHSHEFFRPSSAPLPVPQAPISRNVQPVQNLQVNPILINNQQRFANNFQTNQRQPFQNFNNQQMRFSQSETTIPGQQQQQQFQSNFQPGQFGQSFQPNLQMTRPIQPVQTFQQPALQMQPVQPFQSFQTQVLTQPAQPIQPVQPIQSVQNLQPQVPTQPVQSFQQAQSTVPDQFAPNQVIRK